MTSFDVGIRKYADYDHVKYWLVITAKLVPPEIEEDILIKTNYKALKFGWSQFFDTICWKIFIISTIYINFIFFVTYFWIESSSLVLPVIIIMHLTCFFYWIDVIASAFKKYPKENTKEWKLLNIILDSISLIPFSTIYCLWVKKIDPGTVWRLRSITLIRFYRIPRFLLQISYAEKNHWQMLLINYISFLIIFILTFANLFLYDVKKYNEIKVAHWNETAENKAITSLYFVTQTVFNVAYGDIKAVSYDQMAFNAFAMSLGASMTMGLFTGMLTISFTNKAKNRETFRCEYEASMKIFKERKIEKKVLEKIRDNMQLLWECTDGCISTPSVHILPLSLQKEIFFDINFGFLNHSLIFQMRPRSFLRSVSLLVRHVSYLPGDIILEPFGSEEAMICVASGVIEIISEENDDSPLLSLTRGTILGETSLFISRHIPCFVRASTFVELQVLRKVDFSRLALKYPDIIRSMRQDILDRLFYTQRSIELHMQFSDADPNFREIERRKRTKVFLDSWKESQKTGVSNKNESDYKSEILELYVVCENIPRVKTLPIDIKRSKPWVLRPNTRLTKFWNIFVCFVIIFVAIAYPLWTAYLRRVTPDMYAVLLIIKIIYLADLYIECTTAIERKDHFTYETRFKEIIRYKLKTFGFYLDILSIYYLSIYADLISPSQSDFCHLLLSLNSLLKVWRLIYYFNKLENNMRVNLLLVLTIKYVLVFIIMVVWGAVLLYLVACPGIYCHPERWFRQHEIQDTENKYDKSADIQPLSLSLYYSTITLFTVGYGDVVPTSVPDCLAAAFCIVLGITVIILCTAEISSAFKHLASVRMSYQEDIFSIDRFMNEHDIPKDLQNDIRNFLRLQWDYDKGYALQKHFKLEKAPSLQKRVLLYQITTAYLALPLFKNVNPEFLKVLAKLSQIRVLPPYSNILQAGSYFRGLYILENGYCQVSKIDDVNFHTKIIGPINSFGAVEMILGENNNIHFLKTGTPLELTVHSLTHIRVISLHHVAYMRAAARYPGAKAQIDKMINDFKTRSSLSELIYSFQNAQKDILPNTSSTKIFLSSSFINVYKYQKMIKTSYWAPFEAWGKFQFLQVFALPYVVTPECSFVKVLIFIRITNALILAVVAPLQFCFPLHITGFMIFITTQQVIAVILSYLMLHVGYYDERGLLIYHPAKTAPWYLKGSFVFDLITIFPYALVRWLALSDSNAPPNLFIDGPGLILVLHLYKFIQGCQYLEENILRKTDKIKILKYIPLAFLLAHAISGMMILLSCYKMTYIEDSKLPGSNRLAKEYQKAITLLCSRGPYKNETLDDEKAFKMYVTTLYWVTSTLTNTGFGDIVAYKEITMIAVILIVIFGLFFLSYMYATISGSTINADRHITKYRTNILKMKTFMKQNNVNSNLQNRLSLHYEYNWLRTEGETPQVIFKNINAVLREKLVASTYEDTIRQNEVFDKWEKVITRLIADNLNEIYFLQGEIIVKYKDVLEHIYLIYRGKVTLKSKGGKVINSMGCGGLFGNISNKPFALSSVVVIAAENVDVLRLDCKVFFQFLQELPSAKDLIAKLTSLNQDYISPKNNQENQVPSTISKLNFYQTHSLGIEKSIMSNLSRREFYCRKTIYKAVNTSVCSFIILPETVLHNGIVMWRFAVSYVSVCLSAYMFAFQDIRMRYLITSYVLDVMFFFQIFLEFHTTYRDKFGDCIVDMNKIKKRCIKSKRIRYDFASIIPLEILAFLKFEASSLTFLRLNRVLRVYHIYEFYKLRNENLMINKISLQLVWILLISSLMAHTFVCVWFVAVCPLGYCQKPTWVTEMDLLKREKWELYFYSLYHFVTLTVSSGMHELEVCSTPEIILDIFFMFTCRLCVVLLAGLVSAAIHAQRSSLFLFQERISELKSVFTRQNISEYQLSKMWHYVTTLWLSENGKQIPKFISTAPYAMKCEVMFEMFGSHLSQSFIFSKLDDTFLRQLAVHLHRYVFFPGNYIVQQGDIDETMYFINKGKVSVLTIHPDLMETIHFTLMDKDHFGMKQGFFRGTPHTFSYRAETDVEIISLKHSHWQHLLKYFPEDEQKIISTLESLPKKKH